MNRITTCPKCHGPLHGPFHVHERTLICPHCHTSLSPIEYDFDVPSLAQRKFRRGIGGWYWIILGLIALNVLGIIWTRYAVPSSPHPINDRSLLLFLEIAVLDVLVGLFCWLPFARYMSAKPIRTLDGVLGFFFLSLGMVIAVVLFFAFVCTNVLLP